MVRKFDWNIDLTPRVKEILKGIASGLTDEQISEALDVNINTIRMHVNLICSMIGAENRMQAALWAVKYLESEQCQDGLEKAVGGYDE